MSVNKEKQDRFDCKHLECCMDGCYCKAGHGSIRGYGHCVIPFEQETCNYFERKPKTKTVKITENEVVISKKKYILANKVYSDTTLKSWKKEDLIEHIRILEHNWASAEECLNNQAKNCEMLLKQIRKETAREILKLLVPDCKYCAEDWHKGCLCLQAVLKEKIAEQFGIDLGEENE